MSHTRNVTRRDFLRLTAVTAVSATVLSACPAPAVDAPAADAPAAPAAGVEVEWWFGWGGTTSQNALEALTAAVNEQAEGFTVNSHVPTNMDEVLLTAIAGGTPPDGAVGNIAFASLVPRDVFTPLDDYFDASTVVQRDDIISSLWEDGSWQGTIYGLAACETGPRMGFAYNVDLLNEFGVDPDSPPQTWEELYDWHEAMTTFDSAGNVEILGFDPLDAMGGRRPTSDASFFWADSFGFEWWNQDEMSFNFDNEEFIASLHTIKRFYDLAGIEQMEGYRSSYGTWTQSPTASFPAGVQAAILNGYWTPGELAHSSPDTEFRFTWAPNASHRRGIKFQNVGGHPFVIPRDATNPDHAFQLLEFLTSPTALDIIFGTTGWMGPRLSWLETADTAQYPGLDFFLESVSEADELVPSPLCPIDSIVGQELNVTWDAVNYGDKTPEQAAADLQATLTAELLQQFPEVGG